MTTIIRFNQQLHLVNSLNFHYNKVNEKDFKYRLGVSKEISFS